MKKQNIPIHAIVDASLDATICCDESGWITLWNPASERLFGYSAKEVLGQSVGMLMSPADRKRHDADLAHFVKTGEPRLSGKTIEVSGVRKDGIAVPIEVTLSPARIDDRWFFTAILRDITDRKKVKEKLEASEARFRSLTENAADMIYRMSLPDGKYEYVSPASVNVFGYKPEQFYQHPLFIKTLMHPEWRPYFDEEWRCLLLGKLPPTYEYQIITRSGDTKWIHQRNVLVTDEEGNPVAIEGIVTDITELKTVAMKLMNRESQYRQLTRHLNAGLVVHDSDTSIVFMNEVALQLLGLSQKQRVGVKTDSPLWSFIREDGSMMPENEYPVNIVFSTKEPLKDYVLGITISEKREPNWVLCNAFPSLNYKGGKQVVVTFIDISERKLAEDKIQKERDVAQEYLNTASVLMLVVNKDQSVALANKKACEVLGYPEAEILGKNWFDNFLPEECQDTVKVAFEKLISGNTEPVEFFENPIFTKEGGKRIIAWHNSVIRDEQGYIIAVISSGDDITERKQIEMALEQNETQLRTLIETLPDLVWLKDKEGVFLLCNPRFEALLGAKEAEILGKTDYDFLDKEMAGFFQKNDRLAMDAGKPSINEEAITFASDGHREILETIKTPMFDSDGGLIGILGIARDITERKQSEIALQESEERFRNIFSQTFQFAGIMTLDGTLTAANQKSINFIGVHENDVIGRKVWDTPWWKHSEELQQWLRVSISRAARGELVRREVTHYSISGVLHYFDFSLKAAVDEDGKAQYLIAESRDITEHKQIELSLMESESTQRIIFEKAQDGMVLLDPENKTLHMVNQRMCEVLGYSKVELLSMSIADIIPADRLQYGYDQLDLFLREEITIVESMPIKKCDGTVFYADISASDITLKGREYLLAIVHDVTEKLKSQEKLAESADALRKSLYGTIDVVSKAVEVRDPYTAGHEKRVAMLACAISEEMELTENQIEAIRLGATIHDIGKIQTPSEILSKPTQLTKVEFELIKMHATTGFEILKHIEFPWPIAEIAHQHHERKDGTGYPQGLKGDQICLESRIVAVADVVEAISSHRPYRPSLGIDVALDEIKTNRGKYYEPVVVDACLKLFSEKSFSF